MSATGPSLHLTSGRLLARNTIWNLLGQLLPMAVGVLAVPPLVRGLGVPRFGVLSLAWILIGYFSLFDLGIGRALTKLVADKLGSNEQASIPPLVWTSLLLMLLLGVAGSLIAAGLSPWLIHRGLKVPPELQDETLRSFYWLSLSIPLVTVTSGLRGVLEAQQRFRILTFIRIPMSVFSFVGPLLVLPFSRSLVPVTLVLIAGRIAGCLAHLLACFRAIPGLRHISLERSVIRPVVSFGGWMTVSNIVAPFMAYFDRFLIGALLSVSAVAYYTAPFDMVTRMWIIPSSAAGVLFPAFAVSLQREPHRVELLLNRGTKYVFLALFPIVLAIVAFAPEGLRLWLGPVFAEKGSSVLRWVAAGVFVNSLAHVPFALIQSAGRPDITAKLHSIELPVYLAAVWLLTERLGIQGTAISWVGRAAIDACLLWFFAHRMLPRRSKFLLRVVTIAGTGLVVLYAATTAASIQLRAGLVGLTLLLFAAVAWTRWLGPEEQALLLSRPLLDRIKKSRIVERAKKYRIVIAAYVFVTRFPDRLHRELSAMFMIPRLRSFKSSEAASIVDFAMANRAIRPQQVREELLQLARTVEKRKPRFILEIGSCDGGTLFVMSRLAHPNSTVISVDLPGGRFGGGYPVLHVPIFRRLPLAGQTLHLLRGDSHCAETRNQVSAILKNDKLDVLLIDGDHSYQGVQADFEMYAPLVRKGGIIIFHDIARHNPSLCSEVEFFWTEIKSKYPHEEIIDNLDQGWAGIGIIYV